MSILGNIYGSVGKARYLRSAGTKPERILWRRLRNRQFHGLKFRRQVPIGKYVADFVCVERKIIIELDGYMHAWSKMKDEKRDWFLMQKGFRVIRFKNVQVKKHINKVLNLIAKECEVPLSLGRGVRGEG
ncbi:MAG: endonuclease domain-containing protein [Candidatus Peribacteraceae bacterium]|nr:endonuclease domain-containing protein [Candidatus Peribacteraceae bacterium]HCI04213.1 hypothetical protein [Candidatus Peribacteria bacterium]